MRIRDFKGTLSSKDGGETKQPIPGKREEEPVQDKDYYLFESQLLDGEVIILCKVKSALKYLRDNYPGIVIYSPLEIEELYKLKDDEDAIKKIHLVKKKFGGWIVPSKSNTIKVNELLPKKDISRA